MGTSSWKKWQNGKPAVCLVASMIAAPAFLLGAALASCTVRQTTSWMKACLMYHFCGPCTVCCYAPERRKEKFIAAFGLNSGSICESECLTWVCCGHCANCQEARELSKRNLTDHASYSSGASAVGKAAGGAAPA